MPNPRTFRLLCLALALALGAAPSIAHAQRESGGDVSGARDFEGIPRFKGSRIIGYQTLPFDHFTIPLGPVYEDQNDEFKHKLRDMMAVEGKVVGYVYRIPAGASSLEVFRNYQQALKTAGYEPLWSCDSEETCGRYAQEMVGRWLYHGSHIMNDSGIRSAQAAMYGEEIKYLAAMKTGGGGDTYVSLVVAREQALGGTETDSISVVMHVIQPKLMDDRMEFVSADKMAKDIGTQGRIALYGIYFDTDKAEVKPESKPTLAEIAKLLKTTPRRMMIVGHTDTKGGFDYNMSLSARRARAVVDILGKEFGVPPGKMQPAGVGFLAPVASNANEEGRAKNRRVELVQE